MFKQRTRRDDDAVRRFWLVATSLALVVIPFWMLTLDVVFAGPLDGIDHRVASRMHQAALDSRALTTTTKAVTSLGSTPTLIAIALGASVYFVRRERRWRAAAFLAGTDLLGLALNNLVKVIVGRDRPLFVNPVATAFGKSFPSGHAMNSTVVLGTLLAMLWWRRPRHRDRAIATAAVSAAIMAIAASRVVLSVHYITDVVAGITLGAATVLLSTAWFRVWRFAPKRSVRSIL